MLLNVHSILQLSEELLNEGFEYVLSERFTQDALESYFSLLPARANAPNTAMSVYNPARLLIASQVYDHKSQPPPVDSENCLLEICKEFPAELATIPAKMQPVGNSCVIVPSCVRNKLAEKQNVPRSSSDPEAASFESPISFSCADLDENSNESYSRSTTAQLRPTLIIPTLISNSHADTANSSSY